MKFIKILLISSIAFSTFANDKIPSLLIYGDSISAGYGMSSEEQWSEDLKILFKQDNLDINILN